MSAPDRTAATFRPVLQHIFPGRWNYASVVALYPSSHLVAHRDPSIQGTRYHLPLAINPGCWAFHHDTWQQLQEGRVYSMDPTLLHGAVNWGTSRRLHLVIDMET